MNNIGLLAYGETGYFALKSLIQIFKIDWIITPPIDSNHGTDHSKTEDLAKKGATVYKTSDVGDWLVAHL